MIVRITYNQAVCFGRKNRLGTGEENEAAAFPLSPGSLFSPHPYRGPTADGAIGYDEIHVYGTFLTITEPEMS